MTIQPEDVAEGVLSPEAGARSSFLPRLYQQELIDIATENNVSTARPSLISPWLLLAVWAALGPFQQRKGIRKGNINWITAS
jgi:hypothetical protein